MKVITTLPQCLRSKAVASWVRLIVAIFDVSVVHEGKYMARFDTS